MTNCRIPSNAGDEVCLPLTADGPVADQALVSKVAEQAEQLAAATAALEQQTGRLQTMALELTQAEQRERQRMAQLLHDHIQQLLVAARMQSELLLMDVGDEPPPAAQMIHNLLGEAIEAARSLTAELSPTILHQQGLCAALRWLTEDILRKHGLQVHLCLKADAEPPGRTRQAFLFSAAREMLFNVVKHAGCGEAELRLSRHGNRALIEVQDAGRGFDPATICQRRQNGFGIFSIQERAELLGGSLEIFSAPGTGSRFSLSLPLATPAGNESTFPSFATS